MIGSATKSRYPKLKNISWFRFYPAEIRPKRKRTAIGLLYCPFADVAGSSLCVKGIVVSNSFHPYRCLNSALIAMEEQHLTMSDVFSLFGRQAEDTRWVASADSQEYLAVVLYLVQRNNDR